MVKDIKNDLDRLYTNNSETVYNLLKNLPKENVNEYLKSVAKILKEYLPKTELVEITEEDIKYLLKKTYKDKTTTTNT